LTVKKMRASRIEADISLSRGSGMSYMHTVLSLACEHHKDNHGRLFTSEQISQIYCDDKIPENCKCSTAIISLDREGKPLSQRVLDRVRAQRSKFGLSDISD